MVNLMTSSIARQTALTLAASLAYLSIGLVRGYSSSAIPSIKKMNPELLPNVETVSWMGAIPPVGALVGSLVSGPMMQVLGRRKTVLVASPLWAASWTVLATAQNYAVVLTGRICTGFCVGLVLPATQVYSSYFYQAHMNTWRITTMLNVVKTILQYLPKACASINSRVSECCSPDVRGRLGSIPGLSMSMGILLSYVLGYWLEWQTLAWCSAAMACLIFILLFPLPESPIWFSVKGKYTHAERSLKWLKLPLTHESIYLGEKPTDLSGQLTVKPEEEKSLFHREVFFSAGVLKPLGVGLSLLAFQQISGIDAVIFFTVEIFKSSGSTLNDHLATIIVGLVQLLSNSASLLVVDRAGRKPLLITSGVITCVAMAAMGVSFSLDLTQHPALGYLPLISLIVFMIGFSLGFGCIPFLLLGELFSTKHRGALSAIAGSFNLAVMFAVIKSYHALNKILTIAGTFYMYSAFCAASVVFVIFLVPETKGKTLAEIEQLFTSKPLARPRGTAEGVDNTAFQ